MGVQVEAYRALRNELDAAGVTLVAVSKTKPVEDIRVLYDLGQRDFGENYVQELVDKQAQLPADIRWHFIGHLQTNKVKYIAPFVHLIHGIDSLKLLKEVAKHGTKNHRVIDVLLQVHIAEEATKFGFDKQEVRDVLSGLHTEPAPSVRIRGLMGMASFSDDELLIQQEFAGLSRLYGEHRESAGFDSLSMGMSGDYRIAIRQGSNLVRIGSMLFGSRN